MSGCFILSLILVRNASDWRTRLDRSRLSGEWSVLPKCSRCVDRWAALLRRTTLGGLLFIVEGPSAGGCFSGDTRIALADGRRLSFIEIIEEQKRGMEHFCYTIRREGKIGLQRITDVRMTREKTTTVKVLLDNGQEIVCTPDHRFMLRNRSYRDARRLRPGDSLMPLRTKPSDMSDPGITIDGYEMVWDPESESWLFTHVLADWYNLWKGTYTTEAGRDPPHQGFNKSKQNPPHLGWLRIANPAATHREHLRQS